MKRNFLLAVLVLTGCSLFAQVPQNLFMKGSALAESDEAMLMKRIPKDFPESYMGIMVPSNTYELITALKTGEYEFSTTADGAADIASQSITVNQRDENQLVPYRIRVNYDGSTPEVTVAQVDEVVMFAPYNRVVVASFDYIGNSSFFCDYIEYIKDVWGDERYRLRIYLDNGDMSTYGYMIESLTAPDDDSNATGYFDLYPTHDQDVWNITVGEGDDAIQYNGSEFKLSRKRRGEGYPLEPFCMEILFDATENYTHIVRDEGYEPPVTPPLSIGATENAFVGVYPTVIDNSVTISTEEENFEIDFISVAGLSALKAKSKGNTLTLNNINLNKGVYLVKVMKNGKTLAVKRIVKL